MSKNIINTTSNTSTNKAIIWTKVSALEQRRGLSLQHQITDTQQYCLKNGFEILKEYSDTEGGSSSNTLKFKEMIEFIIKQNEPINLIIYSNDILDMDCMALAIIADLRDREKIIIHHTQDGSTYRKKDDKDKDFLDNILAHFLSSHKSDRMYRNYNLDN